jgi:tetratricopeptide (TPR) repeat protein
LKLYSQVSVDQQKDEHLKSILRNLQNLSSTASYDAARTYYDKALDMKYFVCGKNAKNSVLAFTLRSLALLNDNAGRHKEAQVCYEKAPIMLHHLYGSREAEYSEIDGILDGLATVSFNQLNYNESGKYFAQSLAIRKPSMAARRPRMETWPRAMPVYERLPTPCVTTTMRRFI